MGKLGDVAGWDRAIPIVTLLMLAGAAGAAAQTAHLVIRQRPLPADCNGDRNVDIFDLVLVGRAFGSVWGEEDYDPQVDLNGDGVIDIFDLVLVGRDFGDDSITFVGEEVCVEVYVEDVTDLYTYRLDVLYDPDILEVVDVSEGSFLGSDGASTVWSPPTVNQTTGTIAGLAANRSGVAEGISGSGQLVLIWFVGRKCGSSALYLQNVVLSDNGDLEMPVEVSSGEVRIDSKTPVYPADQSWNEGTTGHVIEWIATSSFDSSGPYTVYRNSSFWTSGSWTNNTYFDVNVDACVPGVWNFTLDAADNFQNTTDTVYVTVNAVQPTDNQPLDEQWTYGTTGHTIGWIVTDPGSNTGTYKIYRNTTCLNPSGDTWTNNTNINWDIDGLGAGTWNYTIQLWDGNSTEPYPTDLVLVTVNKATPAIEMYLNGTAENKDYLTSDMMNLTGTVTPTTLTVVVQFTNGTDISTPTAGVSTSIESAAEWGKGVYDVRSHTDGDANHNPADSAARRIRITELQSPTIAHPIDSSYEEGTTGNRIAWQVNSSNDLSDGHTVYRNGTYWASGSWINATYFDVDVDGCAAPYDWNFTINAHDSYANVTDTVIVHVNPVDPSSTHPSDQQWTYGTTGHKIIWVVTDPGSPTGTYKIYRNTTCLNPSGDTWNNNTNINWDIDGLGAGTWNYTIQLWDGNSTEPYPTDLVLVTVNKATPAIEMYLNGTAENKEYPTSDMMNLTGTVTPATLTVVVEFTNETDISTPTEGISTTIQSASVWGPGVYTVRAHTDGNANYTSTDSTTRTITITGNPPTIDNPTDLSYDEGSTGNRISWKVTSTIKKRCLRGPSEGLFLDIEQLDPQLSVRHGSFCLMDTTMLI